METKYCPDCNTTQPISNFVLKRRKLHDFNTCKKCDKRRSTLKHYHENKIKRNIYEKQYRATHKHGAHIRKNRYLENNKERLIQRRKQSCANLDDYYIRNQLLISQHIRNPSPACMELKRAQIKEFRLIKELKKNGN